MSSPSGKRGVLARLLGSASVAATMFAAEAGMGNPPAVASKPDIPPAIAIDPVAQQKEVRSLIADIDAYLNYGKDGISEDDKKAIAGHIQAMGNDDFRTREKASKALTDIGYKAKPQLIEALRNPDPEIVARTRRILWTFIRIDDARAQKLEKSISRLGAIGPGAKDAVPALVKLLVQPHEATQDTTIETVGAIGPDAKDAVPALLKQLEQVSTESETWEKTAVALGKIGPAAKDAVPVLLKTLRNPPPGSNLEPVLMEVLGSIRAEEAIDDLIAILDNSGSTYTKKVAATALGNIGKQPEKTVPALDRCCQDSAWLSKVAGFNAVMKFKSAQPALVVPSLARALEWGDMEMTNASIKALSDMGNVAKEALPALRKVRDTKPDDNDIARWGERTIEETRRSAGRAIEAIEMERKR